MLYARLRERDLGFFRAVTVFKCLNDRHFEFRESREPIIYKLSAICIQVTGHNAPKIKRPQDITSPYPKTGRPVLRFIYSEKDERRESSEDVIKLINDINYCRLMACLRCDSSVNGNCDSSVFVARSVPLLGGTPWNFGGGVPPASPNLQTQFQTKKMPFSTPVFRPGLKNPYPFSDLHLIAKRL